MTNSWTYVNNRIYGVINKLSDEEKLEFPADCKGFNWTDYIATFGIGHYVWELRENQMETKHKMD